ncbi:MAG TPA: hypothetical protein VE891_04705, partial [Allosphingosinicella sp.]|nr:hypothetical protein [Allosphingosinicella sp.]
MEAFSYSSISASRSGGFRDGRSAHPGATGPPLRVQVDPSRRTGVYSSSNEDHAMNRCRVLLYAFAAAASFGCASTDVSRWRAEGPDEWAISLKQVRLDGEPGISVEVTNRSSQALCVREELFTGLQRYEMALQLRDAQRRRLDFDDAGFLAPPLESIRRIEPGASARGKYPLAGRFRLGDSQTKALRGFGARASFQY